MLPQSWNDYLASCAAGRERAGLARRLREISGADRVHVARDGRELVSFASNDYLGLASHPAVKAAAIAAIGYEGVGSGASRLIVGTRELHGELEQKLAAFRGIEAALVFTTGYQANAGVITALADKETMILSDEFNHASIIDGCRLSGAKVLVFPHRDYAKLESLLAVTPAAARKLVVSDTVFSMHGDLCDVRALTDIARKHDALLLLDDAHGFGCLGEKGRSVFDIQRISEAEAGIVVGTLSKALGGLGGYVCCPSSVREHLLNTARSFIFSTSQTCGDVAAAIAALDVLAAEGGALRAKLSASAKALREGLVKQGHETGGESQIVPLWLKDGEQALALSARLESCGYLVPAIRPPAVPRDTAMLRFSVSALHTHEEIAGVLAGLKA